MFGTTTYLRSPYVPAVFYLLADLDTIKTVTGPGGAGGPGCVPGLAGVCMAVGGRMGVLHGAVQRHTA